MGIRCISSGHPFWLAIRISAVTTCVQGTYVHRNLALYNLLLLDETFDFCSDLAEEGEERCPVPVRSHAVLALHERLTELPRAGPITTGHHVDPVGIGGRRLATQAAVCNACDAHTYTTASTRIQDERNGLT